MPRVQLILAYEGTRFAGWQVQAFRTRERPLTIQGEIERILTGILGVRIPVFGAGRTDSGVHAEGQVCHFDVPESAMRIRWREALNVQLPPDIRVLEAQTAADDFHACASAVGKEYAYSLWMHKMRAVPRAQAFVWSVPHLDLDAMAEAAAHLTGRHDFASFQNTGTPIKDTVRTVTAIRPEKGTIGPLVCPENWPVMTWHVHGEGFLKQMVRNIMGLLVWVGQGKIRPDTVPDLIAAKSRAAVPSPSAPAQGLTLMRVVY